MLVASERLAPSVLIRLILVADNFLFNGLHFILFKKNSCYPNKW
jgi:hypothetical protein